MMPLSWEEVVYVVEGCLRGLRGMSPVVEDVLNCVTSMENVSDTSVSDDRGRP